MIITRTVEGFCVEVSDVDHCDWSPVPAEQFDEYYGEESRWFPVAHIFDTRDRLA
jgi:hypothetical protein